MNIKETTKKVILELTTSCNLNCKHCFYKNSDEFLSNCFIQKEEAFRLIRKFKMNGIKKLVLTGGEPTIHPDFIEIVEYAKLNIPKVTLCTNGVIGKSLMYKIIDMNFDTYTVSIDSCESANHDEFRGRCGAHAKVLLFTELLVKNKKNLSIHIALHRDNIDHINEIIDYCRKFHCEIVVGSIYYEKLDINDKIIKEYKLKIDDFKNRYKNDGDIIIVGFSEFCESKNCKDQKQVFTVNCRGQLVNCYWGRDGGKVINKY